MARALKVFRTAIGFHDAYVAASSQKAALEAWGTDKDLFARNAAEVVTDPALTREPLAKPGEVIRVVRGSASEHVAALGKIGSARARKPNAPDADAKPRKAKAPPKRKRPPKPTREMVALAERALRAGDKRAGERLDELAARESALAAERRRLERELSGDRARLEARVRRAEAAYAAALSEWQRS